jgi:hypothetical protein
VLDHLPALVADWRVDAVVINGENAAHGFGITEPILDDLVAAGADVVTLGNHAFDQKEALVFITRQPRLVRPANYPAGTPGRGAALVTLRNGASLLAVNVMGRVAMNPILDDPFATLDRELDAAPLKRVADIVVVDVHAEATSEKQALGLHADGRATLVAGTHTHAPTDDQRVLAHGTAFVSDLGMCGDYDSIIGMHASEPLQRFLRAVPSGRFEPADGEGTLSGVAVEVDPRTGLATAIHALRLGGRLTERRPPWGA